MGHRFVRLTERHREKVTFFIDGTPAEGLAGDTLLVALLNQVRHVRHADFDGGTRAGFCLMGACQDCWVETENGERLRACSTLLTAGLRINTGRQGREWLRTGS